MTEEKTLLWLWLSLICGPGSKSAGRLLDDFGSVADIYEAGQEDYAALPRLGKKLIDALLDKSLDDARQILAFCRNEGVGILTPDSPLYPARLARIPGKPIVLYYKGVLRDLEPEVCLAEVGTRHMSEYGSRSAYSIAYDLAKAGAVVVSGMAKGVDGMAHRGALDAGGYTVAVLGNGIDRAYPAEHGGLMKEIIGSGVVLTEFKPFTAPNGYHFPMRNRIISGLCQGTVVIEAPASSGALITAEYAEGQGRDIFALPGKVGEMNSGGTNRLIRNGATIITCAADILLEYQILYGNKINLNRIPSIRVLPRSRSLVGKAAAPRPDPTSGFTSREAERVLRTSEKAMTSGAAGIAPAARRDVSSAEPASRPAAAFLRRDNPAVPPPQPDPSEAPGRNGAASRAVLEPPAGLPEEQRQILSLLYEKKQLDSDGIVRHTGLPVDRVLTALTMLELEGLITALPGGMYAANPAI